MQQMQITFMVPTGTDGENKAAGDQSGGVRPGGLALRPLPG